MRTEGDEFGYGIAGGIGVAERPRDVAYGSTRHHGSKGANLGYFIGPVRFFSVFDNLIPPVISVVHIDIGC